MTARTTTDPGGLPVDPDTDAAPGVSPVLRPRPGVRAGVVAAVALGGGLGSVARYLVGQALPESGHGFPWATFTVNVTGSLLLGALMVFIMEVWPPARYLRPFLCVGLIGGFTTFSTYVDGIRDLAATGHWTLADAYGADTLLAGLAAVWCGIVVARRVARTRTREETT